MARCASVQSHGGLPLRLARRSGRNLRSRHLCNPISAPRTAEKRLLFFTSALRSLAEAALTPLPENAQIP